MKSVAQAIKLVKSFRYAFQDLNRPNAPTPKTSRLASISIDTQISLLYELSLQIQECYAAQDSWSHVIFDKGGFKLQIGATYKFKVKIESK